MRINYHEPEKTALLLGPVATIHARLSQFSSTGAWYMPHWRFGPHALLALRFEFGPAEIERAAAQVEAWLESNPSTLALDVNKYLESSRQLGIAEQCEGPFLPLRPNNSVELLGPDWQPCPSGSEIRSAEVEFQSRALPALLELAVTKRSDIDAFWVDLAELFACVASLAGPSGISGGHLSFRSHSEGFISGAPALRGRLSQFSEKYSKPAVERIQALDACINAGEQHSASPLASRWLPILRTFKQRIDAAVERMPRSELDRLTTPLPEFLKTGFGSMIAKGALKALHRNPQFVSFRLLLNNLYKILPILSVSPLQRYGVCLLVADACYENFGVDWRYHLRHGPRRTIFSRITSKTMFATQ